MIFLGFLVHWHLIVQRARNICMPRFIRTTVIIIIIIIIIIKLMSIVGGFE